MATMGEAGTAAGGGVTGSAGFAGNPLGGPFVVADAVPGDVIAVTLREVTLDRDEGITLLAPNHGLLTPGQAAGDPSVLPPKRLYRWKLDRSKELAVLANPLGANSLQVPLRPFVGCVGTCPPGNQQVSSLLAGRFGGNLDLPSIRAGATVYLPVFAPGALLFLGDIHAAQGHGEVIGGGIETSGRIRFQVRRIPGGSRGEGGKSMELNSPRILDADHAAAVAVHGELRTAMQEAFSHLVTWIADATRGNRFDVLAFLSQTATYEIGNISGGYSAVACRVRRDLLPEEASERLAR